MPHTRQAAQARLDWGGELRVPPTPHARARSQPDRPVLQGDIILLGLRDFQVRCLRRGPRARHRRCVVGSPSDRPARRTKRRTSFRSTTATRRAASKRTASCPTLVRGRAPSQLQTALCRLDAPRAPRSANQCGHRDARRRGLWQRQLRFRRGRRQLELSRAAPRCAPRTRAQCPATRPVRVAPGLATGQLQSAVRARCADTRREAACSRRGSFRPRLAPSTRGAVFIPT